MENGTREFDELRHILQKLDRSLDEAQHKRQHTTTPMTPSPAAPPAHAQTHQAPSPSQAPAAPSPAVLPDEQDEIPANPGRLKAKPLRRNRPENQGPTHGWVR